MTPIVDRMSVSAVMLRIIAAVIGAVGLAWGILTLPTSWNEFPVNQIADSVVRGETFPLNILETQIATARQESDAGYCKPAIAHSAAILQLAILNQSFDASSSSVDEDLEKARQSVISGLSCAPADSYLWFALFQIESLQSGFRSEYVRHLAMSYRVGPNEAWIAIPRNRAAFAIFEALPGQLQSDVLDEFCLLLRTELYIEAVDIFLGPAAAHRQQVIDRLSKVPTRNRQLFAVLLARKGYQFNIPGTSTVVHGQPKN